MESTFSTTKSAFSRPNLDQAFKLLAGDGYPYDWDGLIELRSKVDGRMSQAWFECATPELFRWVEEHAGKGNIYVGRSPRSCEGGSARDIDSVFLVTLDIDPVRATSQDDPSSEGELERAKIAAKRVEDYVKAQYGATPIVVMTGNGYQLWYKLEKPVDVRGRRRWWERGQRSWEHLCRQAMADSGCNMDTQWDLPRVIKLPGTISVKGIATDDRPHRMARIDKSTWIGLDPEHIILLCGNELDDESKDYQDIRPAGTIPDRFWSLLAGNGQLRGAWTGTLKLPDGSPSAQDMALAQRLKMHKFTPEEAVTILSQSPGGSPEKRNRLDYLRLTVQKAYKL